MYDSSGAWGGTNPFGGTLVVLTHRTEDQPDESTGFVMVDGFDAAFARAREAAGSGGLAIGGGADVIRQALAAGLSTSSGSRPRRSSWAAASGSSTGSTTTSTSRSSPSTTRRTPCTRGTPSGAEGLLR